MVAILNFVIVNISVLGGYICRKFILKMQHDHAEMPTWPKTEPEVNSHDVISRTSGTNVGRSQRLYEIFEHNSAKSSRNRQLSRQNVLTYHKNPTWRRPPYRISKKCQYIVIGRRYSRQIWWTDADDRRYSDNVINNCKMAFSVVDLHVLERLSDEYNF